MGERRNDERGHGAGDVRSSVRARDPEVAISHGARPTCRISSARSRSRPEGGREGKNGASHMPEIVGRDSQRNVNRLLGLVRLPRL